MADSSSARYLLGYEEGKIIIIIIKKICLRDLGVRVPRVRPNKCPP
jgi:hypothetical protein